METWNSGFYCSPGKHTVHVSSSVCRHLEILHFILHVQHIRRYLPDLFSLISELWSSFSLPAASRPVRGSPVN